MLAFEKQVSGHKPFASSSLEFGSSRSLKRFVCPFVLVILANGPGESSIVLDILGQPEINLLFESVHFGNLNLYAVTQTHNAPVAPSDQMISFRVEYVKIIHG